MSTIQESPPSAGRGLKQDPLTVGCLKRVLEARQDFLEAERSFNAAAEDLLRSFGDEFEDDISTMAHVIGDVTILVDEGWRDYLPGKRYRALTFTRTATYPLEPEVLI